jgi:hypothetical protein
MAAAKKPEAKKKMPPLKPMFCKKCGQIPCRCGSKSKK